MHTDGIQMYKR